MIRIDDKTALVFDTNDISEAVSSDNGIELVYFGANITLSSGITIYPGKASLTFDGTFEGVTYTFTDMSVVSPTNTIGIRSASNITITVQNIKLVGRNFYGIPYVANDAAISNVSVIYDKVSYGGTQLAHNPYGFVSFNDCELTVTVGEGAEASRVEIGGTTTINKTNLANGVFWFYGSSTQRPYLKILSGANVTITTAHYFMYEHNSPNIIVEPDASLVLNTGTGFSWDAAHTAASFTVGANAAFKYTQTANPRGMATLYLDGALTVQENATFYMQADFANNSPLIRYTGGSGGLNLYNPRSFALYNKGNASARAFYFAAQIPFVFEGNQVNRWVVPTAFPAAGTFDDEPPFKWNRASYGTFRMAGRADNTNTFVDSHSFTQEELDAMPALGLVSLREAVVFSEGNLPLSVNRIISGRRPITGKTAKKARVRVSPAAGGSYPDCDADDRGVFSVTTSDPVPFGDMYRIAANTPFLLTSLTAEAQEEGGLTLTDAPAFISFVMPPLDDFSDIIFRRQITDAPVTVLDERADRTEWVLWAKITGPLRTEESDVLEDAVVFVNQSDELLTMGLSYQPVHIDGPYDDVNEVDVTWPDNKGVLARITTPIRSGRRYSTMLDWVVYPIGVSPEGGI